jgi:hypothetical protein
MKIIRYRKKRKTKGKLKRRREGRVIVDEHCGFPTPVSYFFPN